VALGPASFGALANQLLIGNFGNSHINAYDLTTGELSTRCVTPTDRQSSSTGCGAFVSEATPRVAQSLAPTWFFHRWPEWEQDGRPISAVIGIRLRRQQSGNKLPSIARGHQGRR
jgi:hypothetical protein